jgi:hypothetical protein
MVRNLNFILREIEANEGVYLANRYGLIHVCKIIALWRLNSKMDMSHPNEDITGSLSLGEWSMLEMLARAG